MANPGAFEKDFGYLLPFLEKVAAAAEGLQEPAAREELGRLISEEKARWERIRELLRGASGQGGAGRGASSEEPPREVPAEVPPRLARASGDGVNRVAPPRAGLTVGSLKGGR